MTQHLLMVDDDAGMRATFSDLLFTGTGIEVLAAASGEEAIPLLHKRPGVILADYRLGSGMNGVEFLQRARDELPLTTRYLFTDNLGAAIDDMTSRDETVGEEGLALLAMEKATIASPDYFHETIRDGFARYDRLAASRIMVVDDEASFLRVIRRRFATRGYDLILHDKPGDAISYLQGYRTNPERETRPLAVVLTDTNMPGWNGGEVARAAKAADRNIRVVMMTGERSLNRTLYEQLEQDIGPFPILEKPFDFNDACALIGQEIVRYHVRR